MQRKIAMVKKQFKMHSHDEEKQDLEYWLSRPVAERLAAVTRLSAQLKKSPRKRMDKTIHRERKTR